jgi:hypothetical protein
MLKTTADHENYLKFFLQVATAQPFYKCSGLHVPVHR